MSDFEQLPERAAEVFGEGATAEEAYGLLTVDVPPAGWVAALTAARDGLGCTFFDWLSAVDEPGTGFRICVHVVRLEGGVGRLLVRTTVPHDAAELATATGVYAGADWHERETHEMFGVTFTGHPGMAPLLLPDEFEGHPLRKDFVLAARVAKAWPGAKEPGESHDGGPKRRQMLPPGVPDPNDWGPLKGQLPPAPARPARRAAAGGAAGERPARRTRTAGEGSASQEPAGGSAAGGGPAAEGAARPARPARTPRPSTPDAPWQKPAERPPAGGEAPEPSKPAEPSEPAEQPPAEKPRSERPPRSGSEQAEPSEAAEPSKPVEPSKPAESSEPAEPSEPAEQPPAPPARDEPPTDEGGRTP
ncbi:putative NADH dehydrogenase [Actinacidiphila reveromycinica]|uniref:Putative NADH dehydrogenase n=1 Tax=Actinacidiphila reveromycinica TaxID=659352 RepID=A0A7U3UV64_9ACTN|nr:NADH-quinone oxidoreductase subunit C [Streptomyces sp. SN-593]BBA99457.1 putative NADH dehydrogenase [Streptomyces sp. SN-593]